jgi:RNase P/RNase MRP subunit p29
MSRNLVATVLVVGLVLGVAGVAVASHHEKVTIEYKGEVVDIDGNTMVTKMIPSGEVKTFTVDPAREFIIDGKAMTIKDLEEGTVLSAKVDVMPSEETATQISGTIMHIVAKTVVIRLDSGEIKSYTVDYDREFMVDGQPKTIQQMHEGSRVTATKIIADPENVITPDTPITGTAPK